MADISSGGSMNSGAGAGGLDSVIGAVDSSLTSLDPQQGSQAISQVLSALQGAPGLSGLTSGLQQLQQELQGGAPNGQRVGSLLTSLSQQTRDAAGQGGPVAGVLHQLAGRLDAAGSKLSGGA